MIGEFVRFPAPKGASRKEIVEDAYTVVPKWQANPDLIRKHFMWSDDREYCCGFCLWKSRAAAERIRRAVRSIAIDGVPAERAPEVTISVGVTVYQREESSEQLIRRADAALYLAKRDGRDCVRAYAAQTAESQ